MKVSTGVLLGGVATLLSATVALADGAVRCWGVNDFGQCNVPQDLGDVAFVTCGYAHVVAIRRDGGVRCWGYNAQGQCNAPSDIGPTVRASCGPTHTIALQSNGVIRCWGNNQYGQCTVPADIGAASQVAAGNCFSFALQTSGVVRCWGNNAQGQCNVPADIGTVLQIASGFNHAVALQDDGAVRCWGANGSGQCDVPANMMPAVQIASGYNHTLSLLADGSVRCWGENNQLQCEVPSGLGVVLQLAGGQNSSFAVLADGRSRCWGNFGSCSIPGDLVNTTQLAAGYLFTAALYDDDCDANGTTDLIELAGHDCNGNGVLDACDAARDILEDCNGNGVGDSCEKQLTVSITSEHLAPIGYQAGHTWVVPDAVRAEAPVTLRIHGHGDFSSALEYVRVRIGYGFDEHALASTSDCEIGGTACIATFVLTPEQFNASIGADAALRVVMDASIAVDPAGCNGGTWVEASLDYTGARSADCNANGLLDSCEIAAGYSPDSNHNGVIDTCESLILPCPTDFDQSGRTDGADLGMLLAAWGPAQQPGIDLNGDGRIDGADLGMLLAGWGPCRQ